MPDITPKASTFQVATLWGTSPAVGWIVGEFGISANGASTVWRITHLRTGAMLAGYADWTTLEAAIRIAQKLMENPKPWRHGKFGVLPPSGRVWVKAAYGYLLEAVNGEESNRG